MSPKKTDHIRSGISDSGLFREVFDKYVPQLTGFACRFLDEGDAMDAVQEVFVRLWKNGRYRLPASELSPYLYRAVLNVCRDRLRHASVEKNYMAKMSLYLKNEEIEHYETHLEETEEEVIFKKVLRSIDELPAKCREIFRLSYLERKKSFEIAEQLDISRRTVEAQLYKALRILRDKLS